MMILVYINALLDDYLNKSNTTKIIILTDKEKKNVNYDPISLSAINIDIIQIDDYDRLFQIVNKLDPTINNIEFIINSNGGGITANDIMVSIIRELSNKYTTNAHIYNYAMSAATMLALSCNNIYMDDYSFLTPTDPQITISEDDVYQSKDILCTNIKKIDFDNKLLFNQTKRYHEQNIKTVSDLIRKHMYMSYKIDMKKKQNKLLELFTSGNNIHMTPYNKKMLRSNQMKIYDSNTKLRELVDNIFDLLE